MFFWGRYFTVLLNQLILYGLSQLQGVLELMLKWEFNFLPLPLFSFVRSLNYSRHGIFHDSCY